MQTITISDFGPLTLATIFCDYNGTLAVDGVLLPDVKEAINKIKDIDMTDCTAQGVGNNSAYRNRRGWSSMRVYL